MARFLMLFCWLLPAVVIAEQAAQAPRILPVEYFTRDDLTGQLKISPDGKHFAITVGKVGASGLAFINVESGAIVGGIRARQGMEIHEFHWISPTRVVYQIAERQIGHRYVVATGEFFATDIDGKASRMIYGYRAGEKTGAYIKSNKEDSYSSAVLISPLDADEKHILIAEYPWRLRGNKWYDDRNARPTIARLNVYDGRKTSLGLAPLANAGLLADHDDQVRFAVGHDADGLLRASWRPQPESPWQTFALPGFAEDSVIPMRFTADNQSVLFFGVPEGESLTSLFRLDLRSEEVLKIYGHEEVDVERLVSDWKGQNVIGVRVYGDRPEIHWLDQDEPSAKLRAKLERAFPGQAMSVTSNTREGDIVVVFVYSDVNPGDYYLFNTRTGQASYAKATRDWVDPDHVRRKEPVRLEARDGLPLRGYLTRPHDGAGPYPLVVLPHGGPYGVRDRWGFDWEVQLLANRGYAVLQVNFRGSDGYGQEYMAKGFGEWGAAMQDDLTDATLWAVDQGIASRDRICIFGSSYGGYAAMMGAVREPGLYRCAIGHAGVYDLELLHSTGDIRFSRRGRNYLEEAIGSDRSVLRARSPAHNAERIEIPVLLVHGTDDGRADYKHAAQMRKALDKHGKQYEFIALRGEGHGIDDEKSRAEAYTRILDFLDLHLKAPR